MMYTRRFTEPKTFVFGSSVEELCFFCVLPPDLFVCTKILILFYSFFKPILLLLRNNKVFLSFRIKPQKLHAHPFIGSECGSIERLWKLAGCFQTVGEIKSHLRLETCEK